MMVKRSKIFTHMVIAAALVLSVGNAALWGQNPKTAEDYFNRGLVYVNNGDYDLAIADWEAVLRIEPNNADAKENIVEARQMRGR